MPVCIYCKEDKLSSEFSDEHVFPRAFCGHGNNWTMSEQVCERCNGVFSRYESHWAHSAVESMMRNFSGPLGRSKSVSRKIQPIEVTELYFMQRGDPLAYEAGFAYPNDAYLRPQLVEWPPGHVSVTGDTNGAQVLSSQLDKMIKAHEVFVTTPLPIDAPTKYEITRLLLDEQSFKTMETVESDDVRGVWLRHLGARTAVQSHHLGSTHQVTRRLALDDRERIYARAASSSDVGDFLNYVMSTQSLNNAQPPTQASDQEYLIRVSIHLPKVYRCVLKTGINLLCHVKGFDFVMNKIFDDLRKQLIDAGSDNAIMDRCWILGAGPNREADKNRFEDPTEIDRHDMVLDVDNRQVRFRLRLYGSMGYIGYLGKVSSDIADTFGEIRAAVDFMGTGVHLV